MFEAILVDFLQIYNEKIERGMNCLMCTENKMLQEIIKNDYLHNNTIHLCTEIDRETQIVFCRQLRKLAEQELVKSKEKRENIKIRISCYGGSIWSVFAMMSYMEYWKEQGMILETYGEGFTCSGGSKILLCGSNGHRYVTRYGSILFHQPNITKQGVYTLQEEIMSVKIPRKNGAFLKILY